MVLRELLAISQSQPQRLILFRSSFHKLRTNGIRLNANSLRTDLSSRQDLTRLPRRAPKRLLGIAR